MLLAMKKTLITIALLFTFCASSFSLRPDNSWLVIYDDNKQKIVEARSFNEAKTYFEEHYKFEAIHSVSRRSYVWSQWIWIKD